MARQEVWATDCTVLQRRTHPALIRYTQPPRSTTPSANRGLCCSANRGRLIKRASASVERPDALAWPTCKTYAGNTARMTRQMWTTDCMVLQRRTDPALIRYTHPRRFPLRMQLPASTTFARSLQPTPGACILEVPTQTHLTRLIARRRPPPTTPHPSHNSRASASRPTTPSAETPSPTPTTRARTHWQAPLSHMLLHALARPQRRYTHPRRLPLHTQGAMCRYPCYRMHKICAILPAQPAPDACMIGCTTRLPSPRLHASQG
jgi:hypothetical protein